jgi:uncharacterized protein YqeY
MSTIKQQLEQDLKAAMLSGDKELATTLRGLKSAILYEEVAAGTRDKGLDDTSVITVLQKESKKRQDSADLYEKGNALERRDKELAEKAVIAKYLPKEMTDDELNNLLDKVISEKGPLSQQTMGVIIGQVKQESQGQADGGRIAQAVRGRLTS